MPSKGDPLYLAFVGSKAAAHAVENWHYSEKMPAGKNVRIGVWEHGRYIGAVIFGAGTNRNMAKPFGMNPREACELVRVALRDHVAPVSQIVAVAMRLLKRQSPGLRVIVSYADPAQNHVGGIYQAGNWAYTGKSGSPRAFINKKGERVHQRTATAGGGIKPGLRSVKVPLKHRYCYPLDREARKILDRMSRPYPKAPSSEVAP